MNNSATDPLRRRLLEAAIAILLLFVGQAWLPGAATFDERLPSIDECGWLAISHEVYREFTEGDPGGVDWEEGLHKTTYGAMNPNLAKLLFGWRLDQAGYDLPPPKVFPALNPEAEGRLQNRRFVLNRVGRHEEYMVQLRAFDVWLMALAGAGIYLVGSAAMGRGLGILAWALFLSTSEVRELAPLVMTDNLLLLLAIGGVWASMILLQRTTRDSLPLRFGLPLFLLLGLVFGAAASTKLNGAIGCIAFAIALVGLFAAGRFRSSPNWQPWVWAGASASAACLLFFALYPLLWHDLTGGLSFLMAEWEALDLRHQKVFHRAALDGLLEQLAASWSRGAIGIGPTWLPGWLAGLLVVAGLGQLSVKAYGSLRDPERDPSPWVLWCFALTWIVATVLWIPLDWPRYYLPIMVFTSLLAAIPLASLLRLLLTRLPMTKLRSASKSTAAAAMILLTAALPSCGDSEKASAEQPHILLLSVDTLRPDVLGMYGYDLETSPYLDALLADAFHFPKTVATVPRTTPSIASLLTGAYPHTTGVRVLMHPLREEVIPITEVLHGDGYRTIGVVTNQMLGPERKLNRGFDVYLPAKDTRDAAATTDVLLEQVAGHGFEQPLFLWAHYIDPHMPYVSDPSIIESFDPDYVGDYAKNFGQFPQRKPGQPRRKGHGGPYPPELGKAVAVHENPLAEPVVEHVRKLYAADVRSTDDQIRRLVEGLKESTGDNLIIVFTSDHGESLGEHDFYWDHGDYVYNAASRIPFAILLPDSHPAAGKGSYDRWVSGVDLVPTLMDLLDRPIPDSMSAQMDGRSLVPAMRGEDLPMEPVFVESGRSHFFEYVNGRADNTTAGKFRAIYADDWKLIWAPGHDDLAKSWQLFDLAADPHEETDLFRKDHPEFLRLRELMLPWAERSLGIADEEEEISAADRALMGELGYIDSED
ncbi:MAG: sulfatase family protein [Planctomycetota bacterium]